MDPQQSPSPENPRGPGQSGAAQPNARQTFDFRMLVEHLRDVSARVGPEGSVDLAQLAYFAGLHGLTLPVDPQHLSTASNIEALRAVYAINEKLLIPNGEVAIGNLIGSTPMLAHARFDPTQGQPIACLGGAAFAADVRWLSAMPNCPGIGVSNWAFVDPQFARADAASMWNLLPLMAREFHLAGGLLALASQAHLDGAVYGEICGYQRIRANVIEVAINNQYFSSFGLPFGGADHPREKLALVLKESSSLREFFPTWAERDDWANAYLAHAIVHYCSSVRGIIREVKESMAAGKPQIAQFKTADYFLSELLRARTGNDPVSLGGFDATSASFINSAIPELGIATEAELAAELLQPGEQGAEACLRFLQGIYELDFRPEDARARIIANPQSLR